MAVFLIALHGLQRTQTAQFALDRDTDLVGHLHNPTGHVHVVVIASDGLAIGLQRAVHHDAGKPKVNGASTDLWALAMVLVHYHRYRWVGLHGRLN